MITKLTDMNKKEWESPKLVIMTIEGTQGGSLPASSESSIEAS